MASHFDGASSTAICQRLDLLYGSAISMTADEDSHLNLCCQNDDVELVVLSSRTNESESTTTHSRTAPTHVLPKPLSPLRPSLHRISHSLSSSSASSISSSTSFRLPPTAEPSNEATQVEIKSPLRRRATSASSRPTTPEQRSEQARKIWRELCWSIVEMAYQWTRQEKFKRGVWSVAIASVIFVGAITGAQLKTDKQKEEAIKNFRAITPADQIAILETQKGHLLQQRAGFERKLELFKERVKEREEEKLKRAK